MRQQDVRIRTLALSAACVFALLPGCVRRTISISSDPPGALVWLNDREIGRTPVEIEFLYYGTYDVRLSRDGYEPLHAPAEAKPPWWDTIPLDLISEVVPGEQVSRIEWHFDLQPLQNDPDELLERARQMREVDRLDADAVDAPQSSES